MRPVKWDSFFGNMKLKRYEIFCDEFGHREKAGILRPSLDDENYWEILFTTEFAHYVRYQSFIGTYHSCISVLSSLFKGHLHQY